MYFLSQCVGRGCGRKGGGIESERDRETNGPSLGKGKEACVATDIFLRLPPNKTSPSRLSSRTSTPGSAWLPVLEAVNGAAAWATVMRLGAGNGEAIFAGLLE